MPVYLIAAGDTGMVKIGWAVDPKQRLQDLQTAHYERLRIIRVIETTGPVERWLHRRYSTLRVRGEWHRFDPEMLTAEPPSEAPVVLDDTLSAVEAFLFHHDMNATEFGTRSVNDPTLVHEMRRGRECRRAMRSKITAFIQAHASVLASTA